MLFPGFGQAAAQELSPVKQLAEAVRLSSKKSLTSIETQLMLRELYDQNFGISQHDDPRRPLSIVAMQTKETLGPYSRTYRLYHRFASLNVGDLFKISINDFLNQPRELVEMMFTIAEHRAQAKGQEDGNTLRNIEKQLQQELK